METANVGRKSWGALWRGGREDVCGKGRVTAWARLRGAQHETGWVARPLKIVRHGLRPAHVPALVSRLFKHPEQPFDVNLAMLIIQLRTLSLEEVREFA